MTSSPHERMRRKSRHTWRGAIGTRFSGSSRSVTVQPLFVTSQSTNAPTASGSESSMRKFTMRRKSPYGFGTGRATTAGCIATFVR